MVRPSTGEPGHPDSLAIEEATGRGSAAQTIGIVPSFDGVRAIAVLVIVAYHAPLVQAKVMPGGFLGVDIFFVLSGFLITSILVRERARTNRIGVGSFYARRALRLLPALVAFLAVHAIWATVTGIPAHREVPAVLSALFYATNWLHASQPGVPGMGHIWSLQVEEQFYLVWPLLLVVLLSLVRRRELAALATGLLAIGFAVLRAYYFGVVWHGSAYATYVLYVWPQFRADTLLIGAFAAQLWLGGWLPKRVLAVIAWPAAAMVVWWVARVAATDHWVFYWGFPVFATAVAIVLCALVTTEWPVKRLLSIRPLCVIGIVSYGIYLWHYLMLTIVEQAWPRWGEWPQTVVGLGLTAVAVTASWFLVERPFLRLKDRITRRGVAPEGPLQGSGPGSALVEGAEG